MNEKKRAEYVEKVGVFFDQNGQPPVAGRIIGYLLTSNEKGRSFYEIQEFVKASKSSVSTAINSLVQKNIVKYLTISGDRKRYFFINLKPWTNKLEDSVGYFNSFANLIDECIALREDKASPFAKDLENLQRFQRYLADEIPLLLDKWNKLHS